MEEWILRLLGSAVLLIPREINRERDSNLAGKTLESQYVSTKTSNLGRCVSLNTLLRAIYSFYGINTRLITPHFQNLRKWSFYLEPFPGFKRCLARTMIGVCVCRISFECMDSFRWFDTLILCRFITHLAIESRASSFAFRLPFSLTFLCAPSRLDRKAGPSLPCLFARIHIKPGWPAVWIRGIEFSRKYT